MSITVQILLYGFSIAVILGAVATKTNFCTMGAVSDVVNMGDSGRMRAWMFALAVAMLGVVGLQYFGLADMSLTASNETANPPYLTNNFAWPRYILGGLIFGVGMTLGSGCGNKTLIRLGGGNLKSLFVLAAMGVSAYAMIFTNFSYVAFLQWMEPAFIDLGEFGLADQGLHSVLGGLTGSDPQALRYVVGLLFGGLLIVWAFLSRDFSKSFDNILAGLVVGLCVVAAWWVTAGAMGQLLLEEKEFMDVPPFASGAQAFTFVQPAGHLIHWVNGGFVKSLFSFALAAGAGVLIGALAYSLLSKTFRIEWFTDWKDFLNHVVGGLLMGTGGVLSMGCTIGQGVTGASTLAMGSFLTLVAIILGSGLTMKVQLYKMVYEDEATLGKALVTGLADFKLLPSKFRHFDAI